MKMADLHLLKVYLSVIIEGMSLGQLYFHDVRCVTFLFCFTMLHIFVLT